MREIKFRGRRSYDRKWIYGNLVIDEKGCKHIVPYDKFYEDGHHLKYDDETDEPVFFDEDTIGWFTGLRDNNNKEIYEGDIVSWGFAPCVVKLSTMKIPTGYDMEEEVTMCGWVAECKNETDSLDEKCSIIGNIHENPELLNGGTK
jgi:uncharacterized phage protein (TIGR01671 family)